MLIGRLEEKKILKNALAKDESSFIAIYGRLRVGKTILINEVYKGEYSFQVTGITPSSKAKELDIFTEALKEYGLKDFKKPKTRIEAFSLLKILLNNIQKPKKLIFLDELSWLASPSNEFIEALSNFWNSWVFLKKDIVLVVCSSSANRLINNIIHSKGGLYQRLTDEIYLKPFTLAECELYAKEKDLPFDRYSIVEAYMILGGIPHYWSKLNKLYSLSQNIDYLFGDIHAPLKGEFEYLYSSLFNNYENYIKVIKCLGSKKKGLTRKEIIDELKLSDNGGITNILNNLENCDFIRSYKQFGKKRNNSIYQLIDNFSLFYMDFEIDKNDDPKFFTHSLKTPKTNSWCGLAFERVCLTHIEQIKNKIGISGIRTSTSSFYIKEDKERGIVGSQIDLVLSRSDRVINLCEIKFSSEKYIIDKSLDEKIRNRCSDFLIETKTKYAIQTVFITTYGLVQNMYANKIPISLTMDDLF